MSTKHQTDHWREDFNKDRDVEDGFRAKVQAQIDRLIFQANARQFTKHGVLRILVAGRIERLYNTKTAFARYGMDFAGDPLEQALEELEDTIFYLCVEWQRRCLENQEEVPLKNTHKIARIDTLLGALVPLYAQALSEFQRNQLR